VTSTIFHDKSMLFLVLIVAFFVGASATNAFMDDALAGIMVPMTADATHDENHKSKLLVVFGGGPFIFIDKNNDGECTPNEKTSISMSNQRAVDLVQREIMSICEF